MRARSPSPRRSSGSGRPEIDDWPTRALAYADIPVDGDEADATTDVAKEVAALARTETQVAIYGTLLVLVLASMSGCLMGDRSLMPEQMQELSRFTPHAWALDAYQQLLVSSEPNTSMVLTSCLVLAGFGTGFLGLAWAFLRLE